MSIDYWYNNERWKYDPITKVSTKTCWKPGLKPMRFVEYGAPSIDKAGNQPNIFYNPESATSGVPRHSSGEAENAIQRKVILANLEFAEKLPYIEKMYIWCWDARGIGWYKDPYYSDGYLWRYGHWVDGKFVNLEDYKITFVHNKYFFKSLDLTSVGTIEIPEGMEIFLQNGVKIKCAVFKNYGKIHTNGKLEIEADVLEASGTLLSNSGSVTLKSPNMILKNALIQGSEVSLKSINGTIIIAPHEKHSNIIYSLEGSKIKVIAGQSNALDISAFSNIRHNYIHIQINEVYSTLIKSTSGMVDIYAGKSANFTSAKISSATDVRVVSPEVVGDFKSNSFYKDENRKWRRGGLAGACGGKKYSTSLIYNTDPVMSEIDFNGNLTVISEKNQVYAGVQIRGESAFMQAGNEEVKGSVSFTPAFKHSENRETFRKTGLSIGFSGSGLTFWENSGHQSQNKYLTIVPTTIELSQNFTGLSNGRWSHLSTKLLANNTISIITPKFDASALEDMTVGCIYSHKASIGIGIASKNGEFGLKIGASGAKAERNEVRKQYKALSEFIAHNITIKTDHLEDAGVVYKAVQMSINAKVEYHGILQDVITQNLQKSLIETGFTIGVRTSFGAVSSGVKNIANGDYKSPEGLINTYFAAQQLYNSALKVLSPKFSHGISGGIWAYFHHSETHQTTTITQSIPTVISVSEMLTSKSDELRLLGTQITAYDAYITTKYFKGDAAANQFIQTESGNVIDARIPIKGTVPAALETIIHKGTLNQKLTMNVNINVMGNFDVKVSGEVDLKGVYIMAKSVEMFCERLALESIQDLVERSAWDGILGISLGENLKGLGGLDLGFEDGKSKKHLVERISGIFGYEKTKIIVGRILEMNGAVIAAAQRNDDWSYSDAGELTLKVGELVVKHIHGFDDGKTLGFAVGMGEKFKDWSFSPIIGAHKGDQITYSTIGYGKVEVESGDLRGVNRNLNLISVYDKNYELKRIKGYFSNFDRCAVEESLLYDKEGKFIDFEATLESLSSSVKSFFFDAKEVEITELEQLAAPEEYKTDESIKQKIEEVDRKVTKNKSLKPKEKAKLKEFHKKLIVEHEAQVAIASKMLITSNIIDLLTNNYTTFYE